MGIPLGHNPSIFAERQGFEPWIQLPVCRISSAVHSTTLASLLFQGAKIVQFEHKSKTYFAFRKLFLPLSC